MLMYRFLLCSLIVWCAKICQSYGRQPTPSPSADLDSKYKRLSQTLHSLDKIQKKDAADGLRPNMQIHNASGGRHQQQQHPSDLLTDDGSGSSPLSDDDDYPENSGSEPVDDNMDPEDDGIHGHSTPGHGEDGIGLEDISPVVIVRARTEFRMITEQFTTSSTNTPRPTIVSSVLSTSSTLRILKMTSSSTSSTSSRPPIPPPPRTSSTKKTAEVSHVESSEYEPKRDSPTKGCSNLHPTFYVNFLVVLLSIRTFL